jgi:hypothetical protein
MTDEADKAGRSQEGESGRDVADWQDYLSELYVKLYAIVARDNYPYKGKTDEADNRAGKPKKGAK